MLQENIGFCNNKFKIKKKKRKNDNYIYYLNLKKILLRLS